MIPDPRDPAYVGALVYFDRAATALSFAKAAAVLGVTPSAVSHRISALESSLGHRLFERKTRRIQLTPEGVELAEMARRIFDDVRLTTLRLVRTRVLRVSVGPYLSSMWLMRRLNGFETEHEDLRVDLIHTVGKPRDKDVDISIVWEDVDPRPEGHKDLFDAVSVPVTAPYVLSDTSFWNTGLPPIHYRDRGPWRHWLKLAGAPLEYAEQGELLHDPNLVFEVAAHGRGIAIGFLPFVTDLFEMGRLVPASDIEVPSQRVYRLVVQNPDHPDADVFARWLLTQVQKLD